MVWLDYVGDNHKGPLIIGEITPFQKIIKVNKQSRKPQITPRMAVVQGREGPTAQKALAAQQTAAPRHPLSEPPPRSRARCHTTKPPPHSRAWRPLRWVPT
jgi:hypothetical protein